MAARLFSKTGDTRGFELELEGDREAIVGRDPASDLVIERPLMSSRHARIFYDGDAGRYVLEDLDSLNGTDLDGDRVTGSERLGHLHVITFAGSYDFFFFDSERGARRHPAEAPRTTEKATSQKTATEQTPTEPAVKPGAAEPDAGEKDEVTSVEREPLAMPGFLARRADAISEAVEHGRPPAPSEITSIEHEPVGLPSFLADRADQVRAGEPRAGESPAREPRVEQAQDSDVTPAGAGDQAKTDKREDTVREKLPIGLPGILARRADEATDGERVQRHETVDLSQIEELITAEEAMEAAERDAHRAEGLHLIVTESGGQVRQYPLVEGENVVGRGARVQVALKYPDLSRRHARLTVDGGQITLRDLGSRNRTFVDDQPVDPEADVDVKPGARLRFGSVEARLAKVGG